jgi:hypothetical protein
MIEANQLRIGNWVKWQSTIIHVTSPDVFNRTVSKCEESRCFGIELTATILEQAGFIKGKPFEKTGHVPYHDKEYKGFVIMDCLDGTFWLADYTYDVKVEFVHWLQNMYYFLIGSELNINL